jgi:hypothetical protein
MLDIGKPGRRSALLSGALVLHLDDNLLVGSSLGEQRLMVFCV